MRTIPQSQLHYFIYQIKKEPHGCENWLSLTGGLLKVSLTFSAKNCTLLFKAYLSEIFFIPVETQYFMSDRLYLSSCQTLSTIILSSVFMSSFRILFFFPKLLLPQGLFITFMRMFTGLMVVTFYPLVITDFVTCCDFFRCFFQLLANLPFLHSQLQLSIYLFFSNFYSGTAQFS